MGAIIWLASYPKSGNTWMRAFLHNLLRDPERPANINELDQFCLGDSQFHWYREVSGRDLKDSNDADLAKLRPKVHEAFTKSFPDSVFAKTHNALTSAYDVPLVTMEFTAGAIYILRNPLDVVISLADHYGSDIDTAIAAMADPNNATASGEKNVFEFYNTWSFHVESWTRSENQSVIVLRYEDLLNKPKATFGRVASFLGLRPPKQRLEKAIRFSSFKVLQDQEKRAGFRERSHFSEAFFRVGKSNQWRSKLTPAQVERIVQDHGEVMARFHYLPK